MTDGLSTLYQDLLGGSYDCVDRIVLNAYFRTGHDPGGFRLWWRALTGSDETLENAYLMRLAGRFSRRVRGYARAHGIPVIDCPAGQRKHDLADNFFAGLRPEAPNSVPPFESNFSVDKVSFSHHVLLNAFKRFSKGYSGSERAALFHDTAVPAYRIRE